MNFLKISIERNWNTSSKLVIILKLITSRVIYNPVKSEKIIWKIKNFLNKTPRRLGDGEDNAHQCTLMWHHFIQFNFDVTLM
jgi:hypothetical protein